MMKTEEIENHEKYEEERVILRVANLTEFYKGTFEELEKKD